MAFSKRNGIDKALDQVDRVLENLGRRQIERKPQENKFVQCHSTKNSTQEIVKKVRRPRGVLLPKYAIKTRQIKQDTICKKNKRSSVDNNQDVLSSTPNTSKSTIKNDHNFTSISHISNIVPQNEKKIKRKKLKRMKENSSSEEEISRCYLQRVENHTSKNVPSKMTKNQENKKKKSREKIVPSESSKSRISTHAEPTQSSINRMLLTEKIEKHQENIFPYVPVGKQSGSHNCGLKIQQEIGRLKLDPKAALSWNEIQALNRKHSDKNIDNDSFEKLNCKKREAKECPQLCEEEIRRALKNINKEISDFIVKSV